MGAKGVFFVHCLLLIFQPRQQAFQRAGPQVPTNLLLAYNWFLSELLAKFTSSTNYIKS